MTTLLSLPKARCKSAVAAASTQATMRTATIAFYYRSVLASGVANGLDVGPFIFALKNLGATV
jgi:hypothetical protein